MNCISIIARKKKLEKTSNLCVKNTFKRHVDLLFIGEQDKRYYVFIKDFSTFMFDDTLHQ